MLPVILAGGSGTRFWPLSRRNEPKQLLSILGDDRTMIESTLERLLPLAGERPVHVVCRPDLVAPSIEALSTARDVEFIEEPAARNTAPAIALGAAHMEARYGDEAVAFFPADHFISGQAGFEKCLHLAEARADEGAIVTLGIAPTRPETGFGYIECESLDENAPLAAYPVKAFVEKPDRERALYYLQQGRFLWNSGIFVFRPSTLWAEFHRQQPEMARLVDEIRELLKSDLHSTEVAPLFEQLESISIDYAVMENAAGVEVIPARFRWSDVGHWAALDEVIAPDPAGNIVEADAVLDQSYNCVVISRGTERLIAASGLTDVIIVDTPDALLVVPRDRAQRVRELVKMLADKDRDELL